MESSIPIQNIYYLLCYAWNRLEEGAVVDVGSLDSTRLVDLFAKVLAGGTMHLIRRGFDRGYVSFAEDTGRIKGKIDFASSLKRDLLRRARARCEFDELDYNVLHNRILKTTMTLLAGTRDLDEELRHELRDALRWLGDVDPVRLSPQIFRRVQLHRNNHYYAFLLNVCELVHQNLLADERGAGVRFRDFLRDEASMARLFEEFVRRFYQIEQKTFEVRAMKIGWQAEAVDEESAGHLPEMRTDVCLIGGDRKIILDCKYYKDSLQRNWGKRTVHSENLYQLYAYLRNKENEKGWENCEGILLYPATGQPLNLSYRIHGHPVHIRTINLNQDWEGIKADMLYLIESSSGRK